jgi:hypothetical protein
MVAELKAPIAEEMEITLKWAIAEHRELYRTAKAAGQIKDAGSGPNWLLRKWRCSRRVVMTT